mmetsp:Transcript_61926/g.110096  ORF Transcript_61926/g.110096 Transcript_61926/m.110096 type:complete len:224 (-) Transcript_61926:60-731(-)
MGSSKSTCFVPQQIREQGIPTVECPMNLGHYMWDLSCTYSQNQTLQGVDHASIQAAVGNLGNVFAGGMGPQRLPCMLLYYGLVIGGIIVSAVGAIQMTGSMGSFGMDLANTMTSMMTYVAVGTGLSMAGMCVGGMFKLSLFQKGFDAVLAEVSKMNASFAPLQFKILPTKTETRNAKGGVMTEYTYSLVIHQHVQQAQVIEAAVVQAVVVEAQVVSDAVPANV